MALIFIDFDYTIANGHTHNLICKSFAKTKDQQWEVVKDIKPIASTEAWQNVFATLIKNNDKICIGSFNAFSHIIPRYLLDILKIPADVVSKVHIESWLPTDKWDKNEHIARAKQALKFEGEVNEIVVIDDSITNINAAKKIGCTTILATQDGMHLPAIIEMSHKFNLKDQTPRSSSTSTAFFKQAEAKENDAQDAKVTKLLLGLRIS